MQLYEQQAINWCNYSQGRWSC